MSRKQIETVTDNSTLQEIVEQHRRVKTLKDEIKQRQEELKSLREDLKDAEGCEDVLIEGEDRPLFEGGEE